MNNCYIVGACKDSQKEFTYDESDFIIGVDGGTSFLKEKNYRIDLVLGDFDSLGYVPDYENIIVLNKEKDDTDMHEALKEGMKRNYKSFVIFGCLEGRLDHSIATIQNAYRYAKEGIDIKIYAKNQILTFLLNSKFELEGEGYISIFALEEAKGVTLENLKYELKNYTLTPFFPIGVSNEFINKKATIEVKDGCLVIIYQIN